MTVPLTPTEFAASYNLAVSFGAELAVTPPQYVPYVTGPADRWDNVAWRVYGDATEIAPLIATNQTVPISPVLPQGITIYCPLIAPRSPEATLPWAP